MIKFKYCRECGGILDGIVSEGRERMKCSSCGKISYDNPIPATGAVCFNRDGEILLVKRSVEPKKGYWCLPGGFVEIDETPEDGCVRELKEETGLIGEIIGKVAVNERSESPFYNSVIVMGYMVKLTGGNLEAGDDCSDADFFDLQKLPEIAFKSHYIILRHFIYKERFDIRKDILKNIGAYVITSGDHINVAEKACEAGATIIQYRDKESTQSEKLNIAKSICEITRKSGTLFIVNDDIDIALISGADGVHLGQEDMSIGEARKIVPRNFIIGKSTHSLEQAMEAEKDGADYIGIGPVYKTPTKENYIPIGIETVKEVIKSVKIPFVCIGGLNINNVQDLIDLGVTNFAMVREFASETKKNIEKINRLIFKTNN